MVDNGLEVSLKDNLAKDFPFIINCENVDDFEILLQEVTNCCNRLNNSWEQTKRFEKYNQLLVEENEQLKRENELLQKEIKQHKAVIDRRWKEYVDKEMSE